MAQGQLGSLLQHIRRLIGAAPSEQTPDALLLEQFRLHRDETAFTTLVQRHGPLVFGVCRRVLRDSHAAEDAFQATFLVLARRAGAIRKPEALSSWLHGVAARVAVRARNQDSQRRGRESQVMAMASQNGAHDAFEPAAGGPGPLAESTQRELRLVLDEELARLPEKYRLPMVLCYLEGKSNEEAARQLCWTKGCVSGRLARARDLLRDRLARRGLALSAAALGGALTHQTVTAGVAPALVDVTVRGAVLFAAGNAAAGIASVPAVSLARQTLQAMLFARVTTAAALVLAVVLVAGGAGAAIYGGLNAASAPPEGQLTVALPLETRPEVKPVLPMDEARAAKVTVVLRVKLHRKAAAVDKYGWDEVAILEVLKNTSGQKFGHTLSVAFINTKTGVPTGECTIYLEPYNADHPNNGHWKLLSGGAPDGVSHVIAPAGKHAQ